MCSDSKIDGTDYSQPRTTKNSSRFGGRKFTIDDGLYSSMNRTVGDCGDQQISGKKKLHIGQMHKPKLTKINSDIKHKSLLVNRKWTDMSGVWGSQDLSGLRNFRLTTKDCTSDTRPSKISALKPDFWS
jgi:hypothetical protein